MMRLDLTQALRAPSPARTQVYLSSEFIIGLKSGTPDFSWERVGGEGAIGYQIRVPQFAARLPPHPTFSAIASNVDLSRKRERFPRSKALNEIEHDRVFVQKNDAQGASSTRRKFDAGAIKTAVMAALVAAIHVLLAAMHERKTWMRGTSPRMTPGLKRKLQPHRRLPVVVFCCVKPRAVCRCFLSVGSVSLAKLALSPDLLDSLRNSAMSSL
jgi:hypothetical protein